MSKVKYEEKIITKAVQLRISGKSIPEIIELTGIKKPSLQKIFQEKGIKLNPEQKKEALARRWLNHEPIKDNKKQCSKCEDWIPIEDFHASSNTLTGLVSACKDCYSLYYEENAEIIKSRASDYRLGHKKEIKKRNDTYYENNKEMYISKAKEWYIANPEKVKEMHRNYDKKTQKQKNARTAKYRAIKIQATPAWLSKDQIEEMKRIYLNCPSGFDVDHIVPLRGKGVRGLHVPWNLQYLSHVDNMKKGNRV